MLPPSRIDIDFYLWTFLENDHFPTFLLFCSKHTHKTTKKCCLIQRKGRLKASFPARQQPFTIKVAHDDDEVRHRRYTILYCSCKLTGLSLSPHSPQVSASSFKEEEKEENSILAKTRNQFWKQIFATFQWIIHQTQHHHHHWNHWMRTWTHIFFQSIFVAFLNMNFQKGGFLLLLLLFVLFFNK